MDTSIRCTNHIEPSSVTLKKIQVLEFDILTENGKLTRVLTEGQLYSFLVRSHDDNLNIQNNVIRGKLIYIELIATRELSFVTNITLHVDASTEMNSRIEKIKLKNLVDVHGIDHVYPTIPAKPRPIPEDWETDQDGKRAHKFLTEELRK